MESTKCNFTHCFYDLTVGGGSGDGENANANVNNVAYEIEMTSTANANITAAAATIEVSLLARVTPVGATIGAITVSLLIATAFGNVMVCVAIACDKRLHNMTNYFLMSLAITDLMVALAVMPFGILVLVTGEFPLSPLFCVLYVTLDIMLCTCSILHLCTLSVDRYLCLRYPMRFGRNKTRRRVVLKICLVWFTAFATSLPQTMIASRDQHLLKNGMCVIQDRVFMIIGSCVAFFIPLLVMVVVHFMTVDILKRCEKIKSLRVVSDKKVKNEKWTESSFTVVDKSHDAARRRESIGSVVTVKEDTITDAIDDDADAAADVVADKATIEADEKRQTANDANGNAVAAKVQEITGRVVRDKNVRIAMAKPSSNVGRYHQSERRANKILAIIFVAFVLLWAPFFVFNVVAAACPICGERIPPAVIDVTVWLGYASSTVNPIFYTFFNPTFRETFAKILRLRRR